MITICEDRQKILDAKAHVLVTGGPGCGKTTIALRKAMERIDQGLENEQKVLFLSFSRAAVARIVEAAKSDLPKKTREQLEIQTFHSLCWRLVRGHGYLLGAPKQVRLLLPHDERTRRGGSDEDDADWLAERQRLFHEDGLLAFDLFAPKARDLLTKSESIRHLIAQRYPLVIVDEAQDTGTEQWACIAALRDLTQLVCLADLDQQIYDFRADVNPERLGEIMDQLSPLPIELGSQNNRSPGVEIVQFGNDILTNSPRGAPYDGISQMQFRADAVSRDRAIRQAVGRIYKLVEKRTGRMPASVGYLTRRNTGVAIIAKALQGDENTREITHRVVMDETSVFLATRVVACCLEPTPDVWAKLATSLELLSDLYRAKGNTGTKKAEQLSRNAQDARDHEIRGAAKAPRVLKAILEKVLVDGFSGNPGRDWLTIRELFADSETTELKLVATQVVYLMGFNRGKVIGDALAAIWMRTETYQGARQIIESAIAEDQILGGDGTLHGLNVMTMHKSKGKEFDAVIVLHLGNSSPIPHDSEPAPQIKSRKLMRVAITRAKHEVLLLTDAFNPSALLAGHKLR